MQWIQAKSYAIQPTKEKKLVIEIPALESKTDKPCLIYDKGEHALLYRNEQESMVLDYVHPKIREKLFKAKEVAVCEFDIEKNVVRAFYSAPVQQASNINIQLIQSKGIKNAR